MSKNASESKTGESRWRVVFRWLGIGLACSWRSLMWFVLLLVALWFGGWWPWIWGVCLLVVVFVPLPGELSYAAGYVSPAEDMDAWLDRVYRNRGNRLVRRLGLVPKDDPRDLKVQWRAKWLTLRVDEGLGRGLDPAGLLAAARDAAPLLDCVDADVTDVNGICCVLRFYRKPRYMALDEPRVVYTPPVPGVRGGGLSVRVGRTPDGPYRLQLRNLPGLCVGGASRSGKTRGVLLLLASLLDARMAEVLVVDCKGGTDFTRPVASSMPSVEGMGATVLRDGDEGYLASTRDWLDNEVRAMRDRQKQLTASYWETDPNVRPPLRVVVVDECQELWAMKGRTKEETELLKAIQRDLLTLIRVGASAGWLTILCSQDWTSDVIDTSVRSQLARIAFWSSEPSKTKAILGCSDEMLKTMNFTGMDRADWRGMSIINDGDRPEWVRWDDLE